MIQPEIKMRRNSLEHIGASTAGRRLVNRNKAATGYPYTLLKSAGTLRRQQEYP
jgi:hypothetical protein